MYVAHRHTCMQNTHTHKINIFKKFKNMEILYLKGGKFHCPNLFFLLFFLRSFLFMCICVCLCVCVGAHEWKYLCRPEGIQSLGNEATGAWEPPGVSAGKWLQVFCYTLATTEHLSLTRFRNVNKESTTKALEMRHILSFLWYLGFKYGETLWEELVMSYRVRYLSFLRSSSA